MVGESRYQIRVGMSANFCGETKPKGGVAYGSIS